MFLKRLSLYNFRNYERLCFFPEQCSLIVGENGAGKTNILEALFFLVRGRSFRSSYPGSLIFYEKPVSQVSAEFAFDQKEEKVDMFLEKTGKKKVYLNGKVTTSSFLNRRIVTVLFSPESLTLLKSSANYRRLWVDQWLEMRGEDHYVRQFKKILIQKKRLLAQIKTGLISQKQGKHLQEGINEIFLQNSLNLT